MDVKTIEAGIPAYVRRMLRRLEGSGHEAYIVGGAVRDLILGRRVHDWDVCTTALPDEVAALFRGSDASYAGFGTVSVPAGRTCVQITTMRLESGYDDLRRPNEVTFVNDLVLDLSRRDFTVNAIAADADGTVYDPFCGISDLATKRISCVADPDVSFSKDALRMLRAVRFCAQLGFTLSPPTADALNAHSFLASRLSSERVTAEAEKILMSDRPQMLKSAYDLGLLKSCSAVISKDIKRLRFLPKDRGLRWCALLSLVDRESFCLEANIRRMKSGAPPHSDSPEDIRYNLAAAGESATLAAAAMAQVSGNDGALKRVQAAISAGYVTRKSLALSGRDIAKLGFEGSDISVAADKLLRYVSAHPEDNDKDILLKIIGEDHGK